jgi:hypothetical protein
MPGSEHFRNISPQKRVGKIARKAFLSIPSSPSFASAFSASRGPCAGRCFAFGDQGINKPRLIILGAGVLAVGRRIRPAGEIIHHVARRLADHSAFASSRRRRCANFFGRWRRCPLFSGSGCCWSIRLSNSV